MERVGEQRKAIPFDFRLLKGLEVKIDAQVNQIEINDDLTPIAG